jgi:hypothetical protein
VTKRKDLQQAARNAKEQAADFGRIADKGGEGPWDADTARQMRDLTATYADKYTRRLNGG